ncbi:PREDICTED: ATP-dependent helicase BRM-like isoform X1 [Lupinus angustifolius]|uniref:ATP-dependent helicase BRM-like isoform X1 n=1 Tax=Lupinus angustifolius TaxID=3871 RepID=UPI00092E2595|nr:PREDICTED: ATP-dependent helicase BRM-like isoform X1 [Lupinus angustifolius]XP_019432984.1 PREDICTED: ATP-dependent helicase BRM-like isoform X1 [Lupinus angustifolius]
MQSGSGGGGGRNPGMGPAGRAALSPAAASPSSSSSASQLGLDSLHQHQQQIGSRQSFQQQLLRKPEGNESFLAYQAGVQGAYGSNSFPSPSGIHLPQQPRKFIDSAQHGSNQDAQLRGQGVEQQMRNPAHQAYLQYALQAQQKSAMGIQSQQQPMMGMLNPSSLKDQEMRLGNLKMQDLMSMQAMNQAQGSSSSRNSSEHVGRGEKQIEQGQHIAHDQKSDGKPSNQGPAIGYSMPENMIKPMQAPETQQGIQNVMNTQIAMSAQLQAVQAWARERNIDLSHPANASLMAQLIPLMQSRMVPQPKANESNVGAQSSSAPVSKQQVNSPAVASENSAHANSSSDVSGQSGSSKARQTVPPSHFGSTTNAGMSSNSSDMVVQQFSVHGRESQASLKQPAVFGNGIPSMHAQQSSSNVNLNADNLFNAKTSSGPDLQQMQHSRQLNQSAPQARGPPNEGGSGNFARSQGSPAQMAQQRNGFTKQQLHVLKAQILAFRRLKKGEGTLPQELLRAIAPPPLETQMQPPNHPSGGQIQDKSTGSIVAEQPSYTESNTKDSQSIPTVNGQSSLKQQSFGRDEKSIMPSVHMQAVVPPASKESAPMLSAGKEQQKSIASSAKSDQDSEHGNNRTPVRNELEIDRGKAIAPPPSVSDSIQMKKPAQASTVSQPKDVGSTGKYHGPLFDFPFFTRKHDSFGSSVMVSNNNNLSLAYDVKEILYEEGVDVLTKKRTENLKKIEGLLAINLERKRIRPDLVLRLQIEEKKLHLLDFQAHLRDEIDQQQQEIMAMPDRPYRKFVRLCERQRMELARQVQTSQRALREKQLKSIFQWRKKLLEAHWAIRDARTARNRGVAKYHERMLREFSKRKDDDRDKRMEALKNNDVDRYREMLLEQQTSMPGDAAERYAVLSSFLSQTEEYLHKLGSKITATKNQQEVEEAAKAAAAAARLQGLSEEEVRAAATCAGEEMMIRNHFMEINTPRHSSSVNKYYSLAHAVNETVIRQPSMLRAGTLRDYQLVGLQWMLSLYNNKLNGILADEMGLGKTVQVMALIAYLMEFKGNYGPHLIIVPNAVLVNWKSELYNWLPSVSCIFYVGMKDQRAKLFSQEVSAMKFNVLVTTYEFIMYDRSKLSKIDWKYIIIDEAQRMKDRDSVLARDLDKYRCQRRLLLTGTPLQNDLKELWSLLNLLLPEVFDNKKAFNDWFSKPFQKECPTQNAEDDWLETEKKVIIIHRLHQILEPFMLRRRVEDVEGSLPPKVSIVLKCKMSAVQSAIYDWIKSTGTLRLDPEDEMCRVQKNPVYQMKQYKTLNNRCMELRKTCNHPLLNYPFFSDLSKEFIVKSCGKLWILDRILVKLQRTGHRVLLFSTMTKLLDILEEYLQWRRLVFRRIDGTTSLEDRESAIVDFNSPDSDCFIFLLSIRAAGRGLNLQSADTVVIYDPDPNPKNEEQAVARAHRIGQKREVKVIYMEAVVDKISSHQKEDELRSGGSVDMEDELAGKDRYIGSIESLIRNNIQQYKIDMADEVINAGRFDQRTTHEERRLTLETLLHDEERYQENVHDVPSLQEVNRMIARSEEEVELFDQMDEELDWIEEMTRFDQVPKWLRANTREVNAAIAASSKRPSKNILSGSTVGVESKEAGSERRRGRPKAKKHPSYKEVEDDNGEFSEASSEERNGYAHEEGEVGEFEDDGYSRADGAQPIYKDQLGDDLLCDAGYEFPRSSESAKNNQMVEEAGTSGSSSDSQRLAQTVSPSVSSQKFGSLSALDARPSSASKRMSGELEEGEIAVSGDSQMDHQQSGSWIHDRDEGEDEQVLQKPKIKRKRSLRSRPRYTTERSEEKSTNEMASHLAVQAHHKYQAQLRTGLESKSFFDSNPSKHDQNPSSVKNKRTLPLRRVANTSKLHGSPKSSRLNTVSAHSEDGGEHSRERLDGKPINSSGSSAHGTKTAEIIQRKCKNVIGKLQRRIDKEGHQIVPLLTDLWKKVENSGYSGGSGNSLLDLRKIDQRIDRLEYSGATELVFDVQFMLKSAMHFYGFSHEIRSEARKVHDLFFDILKIAFPDTDFQDARIALSFSSQVPAGTVTSPRPVAGGQSKRHRMINEAETDPPYPPHKSMPRGSASSSENTRIKVHAAQKESRPGNSTREQHQQADSPKLTHPGELVICKKRRNDRDKSIVKPRTGPVSPPLIGPSIRSPGSSSAPKDARIAQQNLHSQGWVGHLSQQASGSGGGSVGWANPVKRLRTDTGKRRPSHK